MLRVLNVAHVGRDSAKSDAIISERSFAKNAVFIAVQLFGDNTLHFKSFVKSK